MKVSDIRLSSFLRKFLTALIIAVSLPVAADEIRTLEADYTFIGDGRLSPAECKRLAAEGARIEALRNAFGTIVSQDVLSSETMHGDHQKSHFLSLSSSEVKGEWLGDVEEPRFTTSLDNNDNLIVKCHIKGRAKPLSNRAVDFEAIVLRNSTDKRNASVNFVDNDDFYLYFSAPVSGYLSVYLADESGEVYCLLPYSTGDVEEIRTKKGYDYIFFDPKRGNDFGTVDELRLIAPDHAEYNKVYVLFSPDPFSPAPVKFRVPGAPPSIQADDFNQWIIKTRRNDPRMGVKTMNLLITPKSSSADRY
ncbi:MAG: DUF4384 domain-containing protein [Bacteroides sp.]|nr:DUF4384 domain-containing protein [Bacteroides sp.]